MTLHCKTLCKLFLFFLTVTITLHVNAQQSKLKSAKDNFTYFTAVKTYADISKLTALTPVQYRSNPDFGIRLNDSINWYEQIDKRTLKTRTYKGPGNEIVYEKGYDNLNYIDAHGWMRAVDTKLKPSANGWSAAQQEIPVYLYRDAGTALSIGGSALMTFNKNVQINGQGISIKDYTVGDNGIFIKNVAPNTDKIIRFGRGRVETDYRINQPIKLNGDLIISEDIDLPDGYTISENTNYDPEIEQPGSLIVTGTDGKMAAEIRSPLCYDSRKSMTYGSYHIQKHTGGYRLEVDIPSTWLNNPSLQYPVTIDPVVNGPFTYYSGGIIPSCVYPNFDTASIVDTIPGAITITHFWVQGEFYTPVLDIKYGFLSFQTSCLVSPVIYSGAKVQGGNINSPGWVYAPLMENDLDSSAPATCCYQPSCLPQMFRLVMGIARDTMDSSGCNADYFYYDPSNTYGYPFEAYIVGHTVEGSYTVPPQLCSNECTFTLPTTINYGVPPYIITHPWMNGADTAGSYSLNTCTSQATANLTLTIPNCTGQSCFASSLTVPPPRIVDACGDTVAGLISQAVLVNAAPDVDGTPASQTVVSGTPITISLSSCEAGTTYTWSDSSGKSGMGTPITDTPVNNGANRIVLNYIVTPIADGCAGNPVLFPVTVIPPCASVKVPSAFTPDAAENNYLHVLNYGNVSLQEFRVYDRWGEVVFQTNDINDKWNGTFNGKPEPVGTYVYYAVVNCQGEAITVKGDVTLIR